MRVRTEEQQRRNLALKHARDLATRTLIYRHRGEWLFLYDQAMKRAGLWPVQSVGPVKGTRYKKR